LTGDFRIQKSKPEKNGVANKNNGAQGADIFIT